AAPSSHLPEDIGTLANPVTKTVAVVPCPDLVSLRNDQLPLLLVPLFHFRIVVRRPVAEDPESRLVKEVRLAVNVIDALLRCIWKAETVRVQKVEERALSRGALVKGSQDCLVVLVVVAITGVRLNLDLARCQLTERVTDQ